MPARRNDVDAPLLQPTASSIQASLQSRLDRRLRQQISNDVHISRSSYHTNIRRRRQHESVHANASFSRGSCVE